MLTPLLLTLALMTQTWTVDDDGPADFANLDAAILASSPGDVILVEPGTYDPTTVTHDLTIVATSGEPKPKVLHELVVDGVSDFTLSGFDLYDLRVTGCIGRVRIDDCDLLSWIDFGAYGTFVVEDSAVVVITRTHSEPGYAPMYSGSAALRVVDSDVVVVDSRLHGPDGQDDVISPDWGYEGISCWGDSRLTVVACDVSGGNGGWSPKGYHEPGAVAIQGGWSSTTELVVRGSWLHRIEGGYHGGGGQAPAVSVPTGSVTWSGVTMDPVPTSWPAAVPAEPFLVLGGSDGPGAERRVQAYGTVGLPFVVVFATEPLDLELAGILGDPLLVSLGHVVTTRATVLQGQAIPANVALPLPTDPAFAGLVLDVQGASPTPLGLFLANAQQLALRP